MHFVGRPALCARILLRRQVWKLVKTLGGRSVDARGKYTSVGFGDWLLGDDENVSPKHTLVLEEHTDSQWEYDTE